MWRRADTCLIVSKSLFVRIIFMLYTTRVEFIATTMDWNYKNNEDKYVMPADVTRIDVLQLSNRLHIANGIRTDWTDGGWHSQWQDGWAISGLLVYTKKDRYKFE